MKKNSPDEGALTDQPTGISPVTREMVQVRARELALNEGRSPQHVAQGDYEEAKRELAGQSDMDRQDAMLDSISEEGRWDPVPGSVGRQVPESPSEDEDDEGRSESEQSAEKGVEDAERDQMLQAAKATAKKDDGES